MVITRSKTRAAAIEFENTYNQPEHTTSSNATNTPYRVEDLWNRVRPFKSRWQNRRSRNEGIWWDVGGFKYHKTNGFVGVYYKHISHPIGNRVGSEHFKLYATHSIDHFVAYEKALKYLLGSDECSWDEKDREEWARVQVKFHNALKNEPYH
jgi:hypothetical protein